MSNNYSYGDDSPIAAFATTPGNSALTLIRCSGSATIKLAEAIFSAPDKLRQAEGNTVLHGWIVTHNENQVVDCRRGYEVSETNTLPKRQPKVVDEVLISVFRAPKSYTGEDSLDISCHGGSAAGRAVMAALRAAGFRDALPGEFTFRAFMNGKLDLTRCESVMELVSAKTETGRCRAIHRLSGVLENEINTIKKQLVEVLSGVEIFLDYSEDEVSASADEAAGRFSGQELARESLIRLQKLAQSWQMERIYQEGILAVIAGRPNAGKSSLFNLLLKEERSIVTEIPGTTRDWIEAWVSLEGIPIRLADTAGLRDSSDPVEKIGVERSHQLLEAAEIVLYLIDGTEGITGEDREFLAALQSAVVLVLWNKIDVTPPAPAEATMRPGAFLGISAKTGEGMAELGRAIVSAALSENAGGTRLADNAHDVGLGSARQKDLVEAAAAALEEALNLAEREEPLDIIAPLLREAVNALGEITGEVSTADILEAMFSKFCVGK